MPIEKTSRNDGNSQGDMNTALQSVVPISVLSRFSCSLNNLSVKSTNPNPNSLTCAKLDNEVLYCLIGLCLDSVNFVRLALPIAIIRKLWMDS